MHVCKKCVHCAYAHDCACRVYLSVALLLGCRSVSVRLPRFLPCTFFLMCARRLTLFPSSSHPLFLSSYIPCTHEKKPITQLRPLPKRDADSRQEASSRSASSEAPERGRQATRCVRKSISSSPTSHASRGGTKAAAKTVDVVTHDEHASGASGKPQGRSRKALQPLPPKKPLRVRGDARVEEKEACVEEEEAPVPFKDRAMAEARAVSVVCLLVRV